MRLGVDFGTTRVVVAAVGRGNYPVVSFKGPNGAGRDWFPPLIAVRGGERRYGWQAWAAQTETGWTIVRSLKRILGDCAPDAPIQIADQALPLHQLLREMLAAFKADLCARSSLSLSKGEPLETMLGVPANANSNQRFLTMEAFREAGFQVLGLLNEPSAASIEFGQRPTRPNECILIYDLGGGTFDASLVEMDGLTHLVTGTEGIASLGGDDFDEILGELAMDAAGITESEREDLSQAELFRLQELGRQNKEALHPNSRRIPFDLAQVRSGWPSVSVRMEDFSACCRPLIDQTLQMVEGLLFKHGIALERPPGDGIRPGQRLEAVYMTGGGSELPLVSATVRKCFGHRARRAARARSATAIGLALRADAQAGYGIRERLPRHFGVWREADGGMRICFDAVFTKDTLLPGPGEPSLFSRRCYSPVHNIGHFRFLECSHISPAGPPTGDITAWDEIRFPFDPALKRQMDLTSFPVIHSAAAARQQIEESYEYEASGIVTVALANRTAGYQRDYRLKKSGAPLDPVKPVKKIRRKASKDS